MAKSNMDQDILKVLYSEEQLKTRVQEMGDELYERLKGKNPLFLGVLKGSFIFMADIVRACQLKSDIEFIAVSSYQNATTSSGVVQITRDLQQDITGRDIVVIEDILDSGNTLYFLKNYFMTKGASSVTVVTLLDKPARRTKPIAADLAGFSVHNEIRSEIQRLYNTAVQRFLPRHFSKHQNSLPVDPYDLIFLVSRAPQKFSLRNYNSIRIFTSCRDAAIALSGIVKSAAVHSVQRVCVPNHIDRRNALAIRSVCGGGADIYSFGILHDQQFSLIRFPLDIN